MRRHRRPLPELPGVLGSQVNIADWRHEMKAIFRASFQQVCDTLEMTLYGSGIEDQSLTYHLNTAEKEVLREKMGAYCMQREHKPLEQLCQEILQEQDAPTQEMQL